MYLIRGECYMQNYTKFLTILCAILSVLVIILVLIIFPIIVSGIISSLFASVIVFVVRRFLQNLDDDDSRLKRTNGIQIWSDRHEVTPSFLNRIKSTKKSIFFVGFTFETTLRDYSEYFKDQLMNNPELEIKLLLSHPNSIHVAAHQLFSSRQLETNIYDSVDNRLKSLYEELSPSAQKRLTVKATYYLPRFAARIFDEETMLLNFYLYKTPAQVNPVIQLCSKENENEFNRINLSLNNMFNIGENETEKFPNHRIIENGKWFGLEDLVLPNGNRYN